MRLVGTLGPVEGVMIADYYIFEDGNYNVNDLYSTNGEHSCFKGYNYRAFVAKGIAVGIILIGVFNVGKNR
jgi:NCS1 family nucleobase:cation symporter-1